MDHVEQENCELEEEFARLGAFDGFIPVAGLGKVIELEDNRSRAGIGYCSGACNEQGLFTSGGFIHDDQPEEETAAIIEEDAEDLNNFLIPGGVCHNWVTVGVPTAVHKSA